MINSLINWHIRLVGRYLMWWAQKPKLTPRELRREEMKNNRIYLDGLLTIGDRINGNMAPHEYVDGRISWLVIRGDPNDPSSAWIPYPEGVALMTRTWFKSRQANVVSYDMVQYDSYITKRYEEVRDAA